MIVVVSSFIPIEGVWSIVNITRTEALDLVTNNDVEIYTQHQTVKLLGLEPATERKTYIPQGETQVWIKPHGRLEFGKEYSIDEIEEIGYDIFMAVKLR